jgi:peptidoglycan/xylan/chitin deacetylase (PgdA/CDA1 family)
MDAVRTEPDQPKSSRSEHSILFLMYHELELPGRSLCQSEAGYVRYIVSEASFRQQMQLIQSAGRRGINVTDALGFPATPSIALTFDDGCETDLLAAAPILHKLGFGATFFLTAGFLGKPGYLSEAQVRTLHDLGFEIGCHSMTHPYLPDLGDLALRREMIEPKLLLEQITGQTVEHFSCPGGRCDSRVIAMAREAGYRSVATSRTHANSAATDPYALGRVPILRGIGDATFSELIRGRGLWTLTAQAHLLNRAKQFLGNSLYDRVRAAFVGDGGPPKART